MRWKTVRTYGKILATPLTYCLKKSQSTNTNMEGIRGTGLVSQVPMKPAHELGLLKFSKV